MNRLIFVGLLALGAIIMCVGAYAMVNDIDLIYIESNHLFFGGIVLFAASLVVYLSDCLNDHRAVLLEV